jgi:hypothetical protein
MTPPVNVTKLLPPQEKIEPETDRYRLQPGIRFVITDILVLPSAKYGSVAKFNGYDIITQQRLKYRYTGKRIVQQAKDLLAAAGADEAGHLKQEVKVLVGEYKTENGTGLEFIDPA